MTLAPADLVEVEAVEQLEAGAARGALRHPHMPAVTLTNDSEARADWEVFEYAERADGAERIRRHVYSSVAAEYRRHGGEWVAKSRRPTRLRVDDGARMFPDRRPPARLTDGWLSDAALPARDQLADLEAIKQLKARYFRHLDTKNWARWREVFADDATFNVPPVVSGQVGGEAFVDRVSRNMADTITVHHGHAPEIRFLDSDRAVGIWILGDYVEFPAAVEGGAPSGIRGYGHYEERYRKEQNGWKIAELRLSYLRIDPLVRPPIAQPDDLECVSDGWLPHGGLPVSEQLVDLYEIKLVTHAHFHRLDTEQATGETTSVHHLHMPEVRFPERDRARAIWALFDLVERRDGGAAGYGHLEAEYVRTDGVWTIAQLRRRPLRDDPLPAGRPIEAAPGQ